MLQASCLSLFLQLHDSFKVICRSYLSSYYRVKVTCLLNNVKVTCPEIVKSCEIGPRITTKYLTESPRIGLKIYIVEERICLYIYEQLKMLSKIIFLRFFSKFLMDDVSYDKTAFLSRDLFLSSIFAEHNNSFVQLFNFTTSTLNVCLGTEKFTSIFIIHQLCTFFFNHCPTSDLYLSLRNIWFLIIRLSWFHTFFVNL